MPALPRNLATKLTQLEAGAEVFERDAKNAVSGAVLIEHRRAWAREVLKALTLRAWMRPVWIAYRTLRDWLASLNRALRHPQLAAALRFGRGWARESAPYLAIACGVLLAVVLAILLFAPPD